MKKLLAVFLCLSLAGCATAPKFVKIQSENHKVEVAVRAVRDAWIRVVTDGTLVYQRTMSEGEMESWTADNYIEMSGFIGQLDMEINGKHIGFLRTNKHRDGKVLITQEGLTVKK